MSRKTIGFLIDWIENDYKQFFFETVNRIVTNKDMNFICFEGGILQPLNNNEEHGNICYNLIHKERIDGLICMHAVIDSNSDKQKILDFFKKIDIPTVSIGSKINGLPSVLLDNSGFQQLLEHCYYKHGCKKMAFIKGRNDNLDAIEREEIFRNFIKKVNDITLIEELIYSGDFSSSSGEEAAKVFINHNNQNEKKIDLVIASNDLMALGVIKVFKENNIRIPEDIIVTGFDNMPLSISSEPLLTTVMQPIAEQIEKAVEILIKMINNESINDHDIYIKTKAIFRESCGCKNYKDTIKENISIKIEDKRIKYNENFNFFIQTSENFNKEIQKNIIEAIIDELYNNTRDSIMKCNKKILKSISSNSYNFFNFRNLLSKFKNDLLEMDKIMTPECIQSILDKYIAFFSSIYITNEQKKQSIVISQDKVLNKLKRELLIKLDLTEQMKILENCLSNLDIGNIFLSLFTKSHKKQYEKAKLYFCKYNNVSEVEPTGIGEFDSWKLVPAKFFLENDRYSILVQSLKQYGFLVLTLKSLNLNYFFYQLLRDSISNAIYSSRQYKELEAKENEIKNAMIKFIETIGVTLETRDPYTAGHQEGVAYIAGKIAEKVFENNKDRSSIIESIRCASIVHDIGKIYVPSEILTRPYKPADDELALIKKHPCISYLLLRNIEFPWEIAEIVYQHHERYDGLGYPQSLKGDEIKIEARILAVADSVEAMVTHRPYQKAKNLNEMIEDLNYNKGKQFDFEIAQVCINLFNQKEITIDTLEKIKKEREESFKKQNELKTK